MTKAGIKATAYCLNYASELGLRYGTSAYQEAQANPDSEFLVALAKAAPDYATISSYAPNQTYVGSLTVEQLAEQTRPYLEHPLPAQRFGKYGEICPEDEFLGLLDICDVFDLIWLSSDFASQVRAKMEQHPLLGEAELKRLEAGRDPAELEAEIRDNQALPLYFNGQVVGCCRRAHALDENLSAHVMLENLASKAGATLALLHLIRNAGLNPAQIDFVIDCSEEAAGDINQRGGGNMAKAIAESAGCVNASGFDLRAFCAAPVAAIISAASLVASGVRKNVAVVSGGSIPKLYMNAREHLRKGVVPMESCLGCFAVLLTPNEAQDSQNPIIRLDAIGKHSVGAGASPQAVTSSLVWEPLQAAGLSFADIDKYAPELHDPDVTMPGGAGNVPEANYKMIAALAVMKGQLAKDQLADFATRHGLPGYAPTQGHIPSGVPYLGPARDAILSGQIKRAMIIGKGSLFLGRLTNLADGASFIVEAPGLSGPTQSEAAQQVSKQDVESMLLDVLSDLAAKLKE